MPLLLAAPISRSRASIHAIAPGSGSAPPLPSMKHCENPALAARRLPPAYAMPQADTAAIVKAAGPKEDGTLPIFSVSDEGMQRGVFVDKEVTVALVAC